MTNMEKVVVNLINKEMDPVAVSILSKPITLLKHRCFQHDRGHQQTGKSSPAPSYRDSRGNMAINMPYPKSH
jgi:hypothetical protein